MRLYFKAIGLDIELSDIRTTTVVVENPKVMSNFCNTLWLQSKGLEGEIIVSEAGKELQLNKSAEVIFNPFAISCNDKKIISKLYKEINNIANDFYLSETNLLLSEFVNYIDMICMDMPYPICYKAEINNEGLYKLFEVLIDDDSQTLLERMINYIKSMNRIAGIHIIITLNIRSYFSQEEIEVLFKEIMYEKVFFLDIANKFNCKVRDEHVIIIDEDLCQIVLD